MKIDGNWARGIMGVAPKALVSSRNTDVGWIEYSFSCDDFNGDITRTINSIYSAKSSVTFVFYFETEQEGQLVRLEVTIPAANIKAAMRYALHNNFPLKRATTKPLPKPRIL